MKDAGVVQTNRQNMNDSVRQDDIAENFAEGCFMVSVTLRANSALEIEAHGFAVGETQVGGQLTDA